MNVTHEDDVRKRFETLDGILDESVDAALIGMIDMFPEAADSYNHDVVDAIIMRIDIKGTQKTLDYLIKKIKEEPDEFCLDVYKHLASSLERKYKKNASV